MSASPPSTQPPITQRRSAAYSNQCHWVERIGALDAQAEPRDIFRADAMIAVRTGMTGAIMLPDPPALDTDALLAAMTWLRHNGSGDVLIWSAVPHLALDRWLSAHGARPGFEPLWMSRGLTAPIARPPLPRVTIRETTPGDLPLLLRETAIPYTTAWQVRASHHLATSPDAPPGVRLLVAVLDNRIVGRAVVNIAGASAGIYDLAVHPDHQGRGIGKQLTLATLGIAQAAGARIATLNSTPMGERMYRAAGFEEVGRGQTWCLPEQVLRRPPSNDGVRFAMLVSGGSEIPAILWLHARAILPNGESPLAHAARFRQPDVAQQLLALGTVPDIAALWQLELRDEARAMMQDQVALHARRDPESVTPLHLAIHWRDDALLEALLDAGANPHLKDRCFHSEAWGWANALGNETALRLLNERYPDDAKT